MVVTCSSTFVYCLLLRNAHTLYPILVQIFAKTREWVTAKRLQKEGGPIVGTSHSAYQFWKMDGSSGELSQLLSNCIVHTVNSSSWSKLRCISHNDKAIFLFLFYSFFLPKWPCKLKWICNGVQDHIETIELSTQFGWKQNFGHKEFTLGFESVAWQKLKCC
jgi:hypothetical protein